MCKYFANEYSCKWMEKYDECKYVHDQDIRNAFKASQERNKASHDLTTRKLREKLDHNNKLDNIDFKINRSKMWLVIICSIILLNFPTFCRKK